MDQRAVAFRESVRRGNPDRGSGRRRFSEPQRAEAVEYLKRRRSEGATVAGVAEELGLGKKTLERWRSRKSGFVRVTAVAEVSPEVALVSPRGYRIEGLGLDQAVALLSRLG